VGGQRHTPAALPPEERSGTHSIGGWVDPRASLDGCQITTDTTEKDKLQHNWGPGNLYRLHPLSSALGGALC
jgi:hypothetical protein